MFFLLLSGCSSSSFSSSAPRLVDISAALQAEANIITCTPNEISVLPGEVIRFRITNSTTQQIEFIVTGDKGRNLRRQATPQINNPGPETGIQKISLPAAHDFFAARDFFVAHDGHEDEAGPNATADFPYRILIDGKTNEIDGKRTMVVTFPEIGEAAPDEVFEYFLCSPASSVSIDEGRIVRRLT